MATTSPSRVCTVFGSYNRLYSELRPHPPPFPRPGPGAADEAVARATTATVATMRMLRLRFFTACSGVRDKANVPPQRMATHRTPACSWNRQASDHGTAGHHG